MTRSDLPEFSAVLDSVCLLQSRGQYTPSDVSTMLFFAAVKDYPLADVRRALDVHVAASKFPPTPSEVLERLQSLDGRPDAEEAWAVALSAEDDERTVVWSAEMAEAWGIARCVLPDRVGARMAFKVAYERLVAESRTQRRPTTWQATLGFDPAGRAPAIRAAEALGRHIPTGEHLRALPSPNAAAALLTGEDRSGATSPAATAALARIRACRAAGRPADSNEALAPRARSDQQRAAARQRAEAYAAAHGIDLNAEQPVNLNGRRV